jgi:type I restriction enzyme S subunit
LNITTLLKEKIPVPSLKIQKAVADAVHCKKDLLVDASRQIDLLQERRMALISAAVTGQIDVRPLLKKEAA